MKKGNSLMQCYLVLVFVCGMLIFGCTSKLRKVKISEPVKKYQDTLVYSILDLERDKDEWVEISYSLGHKYEVKEEYEFNVHHEIPKYKEVEKVEIIGKQLFIKMKYPWGGEIGIDFINAKKKVAKLDLYLYPCGRENYQKYPGMPVTADTYYIKNEDSIRLEIQSYHSIVPSKNGTLRRDGNIIAYTPNKEFVGTDEFWFFGKKYNKCGGYVEEMDGYRIFIASTDMMNEEPKAVNDTIKFNSQKSSFLIQPLANDYDSDILLKKYGGEVLTIDSISQPLNGNAEMRIDKSIWYKSINHSKNDEIEYVVSDINGLKSKAIIFILKE